MNGKGGYVNYYTTKQDVLSVKQPLMVACLLSIPIHSCSLQTDFDLAQYPSLRI